MDMEIMKNQLRFAVLLTVMLVCGGSCLAQSFDTLKKNTAKKNNAQLEQLLDGNDVSGMSNWLSSHPQEVDDCSAFAMLPNGMKSAKPLIYDATERALAGKVNPEMVKTVLRFNPQLIIPYDGKTAIYLILDFLATHHSRECVKAEMLLGYFFRYENFDPELRCGRLLPPLAYLIRTNYEHLGHRYQAGYISDNVIRGFIERGAIIDTYAKDGSTLMAYAIQTDNKYLQKFFIDNHIDVNHADHKGHTDIYNAIKKRDLALLKSMIDKVGGQLDINSLQNDPDEIRENIDLYNYVAAHCAPQVATYNEATLFRSKFPDRKQLVQATYERLCKEELAQAKVFGDVMKVRDRYPSLSKLTDPAKRRIYDRDCKALEQLLTKTLRQANDPNQVAGMKTDPSVKEFLDNYVNNYQYDPANFVPMAQEINTFYDVHRHLFFEFPSPIGRALASFLGIKYHTSEPIFEESVVNNSRNSLRMAASLASKTKSRYGFSSFYNTVAQRVKEREISLNHFRESQYHLYCEKKVEYQERQAQLSQEMERDRIMKTHENAKIPSYETDGWEEEFQLIGKNTPYIEVKLKGTSKSGRIYYSEGSDYPYYFSSGLFSTESYRNAYDACDAMAVYLAYGVVREIGHD